MTDTIEVEVIAGIERREDSGELPAVALERFAQDFLLLRDTMRLRVAPAGEYEQEQRAIVVESETAHLPSGRAVDDVDELVARPISRGFECRDPIAQVLLVAVLGSKDEFADPGMKPVGADDQIEAPFTAMLEFHTHRACVSRRLVMLSPKMISHDPLIRS